MHRVILEVSPTRVGMAVLRAGREPEHRSARFAPAQWSEDWPGALRSAQGLVTELVRGLGAAGSSALVIYSSPDAAAGVFSCPAKAGMRAAAQAAELALSEVATFPLEQNPRGLDCVSIDPRTGNEHAQIHTLGGADTEANAQTMVEWATRAGVVPVGLVPAGAVLMAAAVRRAVMASRDGKVVVVVQCGEHASVLAGASAGHLRFLRHIGVGTEMLASAAARGEGSLDEEGAARLLARVGVPEQGAAVDRETGVSPESLLPLIQPVLQRFVTEIKQSMRFGLDERERGETGLLVCGSSVPRLDVVLAERCGLPLFSSATKGDAEGNGTIGTLLSCGRTTINLLPRALVAERSAGRTGRALKVGVAAAALFVVGDAALTRLDLTEQGRALRMLSKRLAQSGPAVAYERELRATRGASARARATLDSALGPALDWDAVLVMLSRTAQDPVRLTSVKLECVGGTPTARIEGFAPVGDGADATETIKSYVERLSACPIVASCRLGGSQRGKEQGVDAQRFDVAVSLVDLPARLRWDPVAGAGDEP